MVLTILRKTRMISNIDVEINRVFKGSQVQRLHSSSLFVIGDHGRTCFTKENGFRDSKNTKWQPFVRNSVENADPRPEMEVIDVTQLAQPLDSERAILNPLSLLYLEHSDPRTQLHAYFWPC